MPQPGLMSGMFGPTPYDIDRAQYQQASQQAMDLARLNPLQASAYMMGMAGQGLAAPVADAVGLQNVDEADARQTQQIQQGVDHTTPEGLMQGAAAFNKAGNARMAMNYYQAAQQLKSQNSAMELQQARTAKALSDANAPDDLLKGLNIGLYTPGSLAKYKNSKDIGDLEIRPDLITKNTKVGGGAGSANNPFGKINPSKFTPESLQAFADSGDYNDLVPVETGGAGGRSGAGNARNLQMTKRVIAASDLASADIENLMKLPAESDTGFFGGRKDATSLLTAPFNALVNAATPQSVQDYNATAAGLQRNLAAIEAAGLMPSGTLSHQMEAVMLKKGDTNLTKLRKMAQIRQIVEFGLTNHLDDPTIPQELKDHMIATIEKVKKSVPFTVDDVNNLKLKGRKDQSSTLGSLYQQPASQPSKPQSSGQPKVRTYNPTTGRLE